MNVDNIIQISVIVVIMILIVCIIWYYSTHRKSKDGSSSATKSKSVLQNKNMSENMSFRKNLMKRQSQMMETTAPIMLTNTPIQPAEQDNDNYIEIPVVCGEMVIMRQNVPLDVIDIPVEGSLDDNTNVPSDVIDIPIEGSSGDSTNVSQERNLQFKIPSYGQIMKTRNGSRLVPLVKKYY